MFYRENGQFKTSYRADQQILPISQDRLAMGLILLFAFAVVPMLASDYYFRAILIPFVIMALAALGVNILVGYCGQISLGSGAFMAVGAYGAYNFFVRIPGLPLIPALIAPPSAGAMESGTPSDESPGATPAPSAPISGSPPVIRLLIAPVATFPASGLPSALPSMPETFNPPGPSSPPVIPPMTIAGIATSRKFSNPVERSTSGGAAPRMFNPLSRAN